MMPYQNYRAPELGRVGFIASEDVRPHMLPPGSWSRAHNVRFDSGQIESANGWRDAGAGAIAGPNWLDYLLGFGGAWWYLYSKTHIHTVQAQGVLTDVSRTVGGAYGTPDGDFWSATNFKGLPVATNGFDIPQAQFVSDQLLPRPDSPFVDLPGWTITDPVDQVTQHTNMRCKLIVAFKDFLVGANWVDWEDEPRPTRVWWSNAADTGLLPPDWDAHSLESLSGYFDLPGGEGPIVNISLLRDDLIIYTLQSVWRMSFVGGAYVMQFRRIASHFGALGSFAVTDFRGNHVVVTSDDVVIFDGQNEKTIAQGRVRNWLFNRISSTEANEVWCTVHPERSEVWIGLPSRPGSTVPDTALVWNAIDDVWHTRDVPNIYHCKALPALESLLGNPISLRWSAVPDTIDAWNDPYWTSLDWNQGVVPVDNPAYKYNLIGMRDQGGQAPRMIQLDYKADYEGLEDYPAEAIQRGINLSDDESTDVAVAVYPRGITDVPEFSDLPIETWDDAESLGPYLWDDGGGTAYYSNAGPVNAVAVADGADVDAGALSETLVSGTKYFVTASIANYSAGAIRPELRVAGAPASTIVEGVDGDADGTFTWIIQADDAVDSFALVAAGTTTLDVTAIEMREASIWADLTWDDVIPAVNALFISIGSQRSAEDSIRWRTPKPFTSGKQYRITTKARGRRHALRLNSTRNNWRLAGYDIRFSRSGHR